MTFHDDDDDDRGSDAVLAPSVRAVLDAHGGGPAPSAAQSARLQQRVLLTVGAVTTLSAASAAQAAQATNAATSTVATTTTTAGALTFKAAALAAAVALGGAGLVAVVVTRRAPAASATTPPASVLAPPAPVPEPPAPEQPSPAIALDDVDTLDPEAPAAAKPSLLPVPDEAAILERARAALQRGDAAAARAQLAQHERRVPRGALVEERMALQVLAAAQAGDNDATARAGRAFIQRFPDSLYRARVDAALRQQEQQQQPEQP